MPLPFSRACFMWGEPIWVDAASDKEVIETKRMELQTALNQLSEEADGAVGRRGGALQGSCAVEHPGIGGLELDWAGRVMLAAYNVGLILAFPAIMLLLLAKKRCRAGIGERLGWRSKKTAQDGAAGIRILVHAVSMGEVNAVAPLIHELKSRHPHARFLVSTVTATGKETVMRRLGSIAQHLYFPLDFPFVVGRVLDQVKPVAFIQVEAEFWPNFIVAAARRGVRCVLVNGRVSTTSFTGYLRIRPFFRRILQLYSLCLMQSERDVARMIELGAEPARVLRTGNLKFDQDAASGHWEENPLIEVGLEPKEELLIAGSTHPFEEDAILEGYRRVLEIAPRLVLLIAPRHIERANALAANVRARGFAVVKRTELRSDGGAQGGCRQGPRVVILDTRGELAVLYRQATLVFVGGSLVPVGGHNPLEPASCGKAVIFGTYMDHFAEVAELLVSQGAALQVKDAEELVEALRGLLGDRERLRDMGDRAEEIVRANRGTVARNADLFDQLLRRNR
jgi:3-deoxy-D-manno-octulosonic-acid transferase